MVSTVQAFLRSGSALPGVHPVDGRPRNPLLHHVRYRTKNRKGMVRSLNPNLPGGGGGISGPSIFSSISNTPQLQGPSGYFPDITRKLYENPQTLIN